MRTALLKSGSRGPEVVELKHLLMLWGKQHPLPLPLADTPVFGPAALAAVKAFQRAHALDPD